MMGQRSPPVVAAGMPFSQGGIHRKSDTEASVRMGQVLADGQESEQRTGDAAPARDHKVLTQSQNTRAQTALVRRLYTPERPVDRKAGVSPLLH